MHSPNVFLAIAIAIANVVALTSAHVLPRQASGSISCDQGGANSIQVNDIQGLISNLNNNNISGLGTGTVDLASTLTAGRPSSGQVTQGSITVVLSNSQPFASTHVPFTTVAQALQQYQDVCCGGFSSCIGGETHVAGDTGLVVSMKISPA